MTSKVYFRGFFYLSGKTTNGMYNRIVRLKSKKNMAHINKAIALQIIKWLKDQGINVLSILKVTKRSVVYEMIKDRVLVKGCCFVPSICFDIRNAPMIIETPVKTPKIKNNTKAIYWLVVAGLYDARITEWQSAELTNVEFRQIKDNSGLIFDKVDDAKKVSQELNYPADYGGISPRRYKFGERDHHCPKFLNVAIVKNTKFEQLIE